MEVQQKEKTLDLAILQIEKQFGQGAIMRMGEDTIIKIDGIPTGSISLDAAIGIGGIPRGRITEECKDLLKRTNFSPDPLLFDDSCRKLMNM